MSDAHKTSDSTAAQVLIVAPKEGWTPQEEFLEGMVYKLLGAEKPSTFTSVIDRFLGGATSRHLAKGFGKSAGSATLRGLEVNDSRDLLLELLRALFSRDVSAALPGARVLRVGDPELDQLVCADGSFKVGVAYGSHPLDSRRYLMISSFHDQLLAEKRAEFLRIVSALGASELTLADGQDDHRSADAHAGVTVPGEDAQLGFKAAASGVQASRFNLSARFGRPRTPPARAARLRWILREPLWESMIETRLDGNVEELSVEFAYDTDFAVTASVAVAIEGVGLGVGGSFKTASKLRQTYVVRFHPHKGS